MTRHMSTAANWQVLGDFEAGAATRVFDIDFSRFSRCRLWLAKQLGVTISQKMSFHAAFTSSDVFRTNYNKHMY